MFRIRTTLLILTASAFSLGRAGAQCDTGNEPECQCATAPVLCSIDELDGYMFSMSPFQHPQDGPTPLCPGSNSIPNNPTWFAFTAWCTNLTLECTFTNCTPFQGNTNGVQIAIYDDCTFTNPIDCNVSPADCNTAPKTLTLTGLNIGDVYYFLIDGCAGAYCDVAIDIIGVCGEEEIEDWTLPISGDDAPCAGNSVTYMVEDLDGAATYYWYLDGNLIGQTPDPENTLSWPTAGTFELCVDAANDPCVPVTDDPAQLCTTITVYDSDAGNLTVNPNPLCPGEVANISVSGYNDGPDNAQAILITDASGTIIEVIPGDAGTFTSDECEVFTVWSYNYIPAIGTVPTVGSNVNSIDCAAECCDLVSEPLSFEDKNAPQFTNTPADVTFDCFSEVPPMADLPWTDDCMGSGNAPGVETGTADFCNGGNLLRTWTVKDSCENAAEHVQKITINPPPPPAFQNPPADLTVDCDAIPTSGQDLTYTNNASGACLIEGTVSPTQSGTADICGGSITYSWTFTDTCGNTITHDQTITVEPADPPTFTNPPADLTVDCNNIPSGAPDLGYTNNGTGSCLIEGTVSPTISGSADICGGTITNKWTFTDPCGKTITHEQTITVTPAPQAAFVNPPSDQTVDCNAIPSGAPDLTYTNNATGSCLIEGTVSPTESGSADECGGAITYTWEFTDPCGNTVTHSQTITVTPAPQATFVNPPADLMVNCNNIPTGASDLTYTNNASGACLIEGTVSPTQSGSADECGGTITYTWQATDPCGNAITHTQTVTVEPAPQPAFVNPPADLTVSCASIPAGAPNLSYTNNASGACLIEGTVSPTQSGSADECGGTITYTWQATDPCGNALVHVQTITVEPAPPATFNGPLPPDITVACDAVPASAPPLSYTNNASGQCLIQGSVPAQQIGNYDECGGTFFFQWSFTDDCGRTISHTQNVNVLPAPQAAFLNPPADVTVDCAQADGLPTTLSYTNGETGNCSISGNAIASQSGNYDACGGTLIFFWNYTDACGRTITHSQNITVQPASDPAFVTLPPDVTISCTDPLPPPAVLDWTNNETGACANQGSAFPVVTTNGLVTTYSWSFTNPCNNQVETHTQTLTREATPDIVISPTETTICQGSVFDLNSVGVIDQNATNSQITWHLFSPASPANQLTNTLVSPAVTTTYYVLATTSTGCTDELPFTVFVETPPFAGTDGGGEVCYFASFSINLFQYLGGNPLPTGIWQDINGYGVDLSNPFAVSLAGFPPGSYQFQYLMPSNGVCPDDVALVTLEILPEIIIDVEEVICSADSNFYEVVITTNGFTIIPSAGTLTDIGNGQVSISQIPIDDVLLLTITNPGNFACLTTQSISPPDCDCPNIPEPVSNGNVTICEGDPIPALMVSVDPGFQVNWFDAPAGGNVLATNSTSFTPSDTLGPGTWVFYAQTEDPATGCVSVLRTPVQLQILPTPQGNDTTLLRCDEDADGILEFDLSAAIPLITGVPSHTVSFHLTEADAAAGASPLPLQYTNTSAPTQTLYVRIESAGGCVGVVELILQAIPLPELNLQVAADPCRADSNGTVSWSGTPGATYSLDSASWSADTLYSDLQPGMYILYATTPEGCVNQASFGIDTGLVLTADSLVVTCLDNGTPSDAADDAYSVIFVLSTNLSDSGTYSLATAGGNQGTFTYGNADSIVLQANNQTDTLVFTDDSSGCILVVPIGPLVPCSDACILFIDSLGLTCSTNGTLTDPTDDVYDLGIVVSAINPGPADSFVVLINGVNTGTFAYSDIAGLSLPADGSSPVITIQDADDPLCSVQQTIGPLEPCNEECTLTATISNIICDDNGTGNIPDDDTFTAELLVSGQNTGTAWSSANGLYSGTFGTVQILGPFPIIGGDLTLVLLDNVTPGCIDTVTITAPPSCSDPCIIAFDSLVVSCDDNGTLTDPADDIYEISLGAGVINPGPADSFIVFLDGIAAGTFAYGQAAFLTLPADGSSPVISIQDADEPLCVAQQNIGPLVPCDEACTLNAIVANIVCDNNDTGADDTDDTFTFELTASGQNISSGWQSVGGLISGTYGSAQSFGPFAINGGDLVLVIQDNVTGYCVDTVTVTAPPPCSSCPESVDAGTAGILTCTQQQVQLSGQSSGSGQYTWTGPGGFSDTGLSATVTAPGWYVLTGAFADNCSDSDSVFVDQNINAPIANAGQPDTLTCQTTTLTLDGSASSQGPQFQYAWSGPSGGIISGSDSPVASIGSGGTYELIVTDLTNGCTAASQVQISSDITTPQVDIVTPQTLTCNILTATLTGQTDAPDPGSAYQWTATSGGNIVSGAQTLQATADAPGVYTLTVTELSTGCSASASVPVLQDTISPIAEAGATDTLNCTITQLSLDGTGSSAGAQYLYLWTTGQGNILSGNQTLQPAIDAPGLYQLLVTNTTNGCTATDQVLITEDTLFPLVIITQPDPITCDQPIITLDASTSSNGPGLSFLWSGAGGILTGQGTLVATVGGPGTYTLTISYQDNGCSQSASVTVTEDLQTASVDAGPDQLFPCNTNDIQLQGSVSGALSNLQYLWTTTSGQLISGQSSLSPTIGSGGWYVLTVTNLNNGCTSVDSVRIREEAPESIDAALSQPPCYGERGSILITAVTGGTPPYTYSIDGGGTFSPYPQFNNLLPGVYEVLVQDVNNCLSPTETLELIEPAQLEIIMDIQTEIQLGDVYQINAQVSPAQAVLDAITWTNSSTLSCDDCLDPLATPFYTTSYLLTVVDTNGCSAEKEIRINVDRRPQIYVPTAFSPNADGYNDLFLIFSDDRSIREITRFLVFDRWGEKVHEYRNFQPNEPAAGWDGLFRGQVMNPAVFVWYAEIELISGEILLFEGDVSLIR